MNTHKDEPKPDWMEWNQRCQQWMIQVWDPAAPGPSNRINRSMHVLLTDEQADVIFAGLRYIAWNTPQDESPMATGKLEEPEPFVPKGGMIGEFGRHVDRLDQVMRRFAEQVGKFDETVQQQEMFARTRENR